MNKFELRIVDSLEVPFSTEFVPPGHVAQQIWIDGMHLDEGHAVDVLELVRSLYAPGERYIFTCGCGESGCASIWDGVQVRHAPGRIYWHFRRPMAMPLTNQNDRIEFEQWLQNSTEATYVFDRSQLMSEIDRAVKELKAKPATTQYSPYGFDRQDVEALDIYQCPASSWHATGKRSLYFLIGEPDPWLFEGKFISLEALGVLPVSSNELMAWYRERPIHANPEQRSAWLEELRSRLLSVYQSGLPDGIDLYIVANCWTNDGELDVWKPEFRLISREWLSRNTVCEPYLCFTADRDGFSVWFESSPEPKDFRAGFIGHYQKIYDHTPFLITLSLEKALLDWASSMPGAVLPGPWDRWFLGVPKPHGAQSDFNWQAFNDEGMRIGMALKALVGDQVAVLYELPPEQTSSNEKRRITIDGWLS